MKVTDMHDYLVRTRRDLWAALHALPDEVLSRPQLTGERFHCIKDLLFHIPAVTDGWLHEDILRVSPVLDTVAALRETAGGPDYAHVPLDVLLDYWRAVEASMTTYLTALDDTELARVVTVHDAPDERYMVDGLLWHVMLHEVRHTAQVCVLLRSQGIKPPSLDLLFYLPPA
ncbi:MAG: DinB family protein [Gemmatimonadaceae bacterium]|nr:DinB family protein [Gemmatimonadaceae bacterium]